MSLSSDGKTLAVGASGNDGNGGNSGHVRVYRWDGKHWGQRGSDLDGESSGDLSGCSVALCSNGRVVAIGATGNDGNGTNSGHVRVFEWTEKAWKQRGASIEGEANVDTLGDSVAISGDGDIVAVGATGNDGNGSNSGHVRVYAWSGRAWKQRGQSITGESSGDQSGCSLALSENGETLAIGASGNDGNGGNSGHVRVYRWNGSSWPLMGAEIDGESAGDQSGRSVSLSSNGEVIAIGASGNDGNGSNSGQARVYAWNGSAWVQRGADIDGESSGDQSGFSVSLSKDGNVVAVGAVGNSSNGRGSGHVRVYAWSGSVWEQIGADLDGETSGDQSGSAVSLSSDGTTVAIGASGHNGIGTNSGQVRVYFF